MNSVLFPLIVHGTPATLPALAFTANVGYFGVRGYDGLTVVQVRQRFQWTDVSGAIVSTRILVAKRRDSQAAGAQMEYTLTFPNTWDDGARITSNWMMCR